MSDPVTLEDIQRWLSVFIEAWDNTAPHKATEAPVAFMESMLKQIDAALRAAQSE